MSLRFLNVAVPRKRSSLCSHLLDNEQDKINKPFLRIQDISLTTPGHDVLSFLEQQPQASWVGPSSGGNLAKGNLEDSNLILVNPPVLLLD